MTTTEAEQVSILLPVGAGAPVPSERVTADPLDLPTGLYRVAGVTVMADGVGQGDVVRCAVAADNQLVATEVVARTERTTLALADVDAPDRAAAEAEVTALADALNEHFAGRELHAEVGYALCAVVFPTALDDELAAFLLARGGTNAAHDPTTQRLGRYGYVLVSSPELDVPHRLAGAQDLLAVEVDVVAPDWTGDDPVASAWDEGVRRVLQDRAATDPALRQLLGERRYLAALAPILRQMLAQQFPAEEIGPPPFDVAPTANEAEAAARAAAWEAARDDNGQVRWCLGDRADAMFRTMVVGFGLDPDADPRAPNA